MRDKKLNASLKMCVSLNRTQVSSESCLFDEIVATYTSDPDYADIIAYLHASIDVTLGALSRTKRDHIHRYTLDGECSNTASINSIPLALRLLMTWTCALLSFTNTMMPLLVAAWAAKRLSRLCLVIFLAPYVQVGAQLDSYVRNLPE